MEIILRPFFMLLLLGIAAVIAYLIHPLIPEGRVKWALYRRRDVVPETPPSKWIQWTCTAIVLLIAALIVSKQLGYPIHMLWD